jgi:hypothetical protein
MRDVPEAPQAQHVNRNGEMLDGGPHSEKTIIVGARKAILSAFDDFLGCVCARCRLVVVRGMTIHPALTRPGKMWTEVEMAAYERRWPVGTRQRVWLDVLAYTGLRRGDAVRLGRQHVRDGIATLKAEKGGFQITLNLPILPVLVDTLAAGPCGDLTFVVGANGEPLTKESFGNVFRDACRAAGVPGSAHGIRKIAATRAAQKRGDRRRAGSDLRLARWCNGIALHTRGRPAAACQRRNAQARGERGSVRPQPLKLLGSATIAILPQTSGGPAR